MSAASYDAGVPQQGDGWDTEDMVLGGLPVPPHEAVEEYDEFDSEEDLFSFVAGRLVYNKRDREMLGVEQKRLDWSKCPKCEEEVEEYLEEGAMRGEVDIDPRYEVRYSVDRQEYERSEEYDERVRAWVAVFCDNGHDEENFFFEESWLD